MHLTHNKIIRGCWQLASGHSSNIKDIQPILDSINCGFDTFDCADIYLGVEELLGNASLAVPGKMIRFHTKFVPDMDRLQNIDKAYIEQIIDRSRTRLRTDRLDLVQFHWWDWGVENYFFAMDILSTLKAKGKIAEIGLTNVNSEFLKGFAERFEIASLQLQASLFDRRDERGIGQLCRKYGIRIYAYGLLLGGFLSEAWIGAKEPDLKDLANRSLVKYKLLIDSACSWNEFQNRLRVLQTLAHKYCRDIAAVTLAAMLQAGRIDAAIVGLSPNHYFNQNRSLMALPVLDQDDLDLITDWTCKLHGDTYDEERMKGSSHAKVMKCNLNAE